MAEVGWSRESVDAAVCTHLHVDHVGWSTRLDDGAWVPTFPNARYYLGKTKFAPWSAEGDEAQQTILSDSVQPILDARLAEFVEMDHRISPHLRLTPSTGHTLGHVSAMIESNGESAVITGDTSHHPCQMAHRHWSPPFDSNPRAAATRARQFGESADKPILAIGTHSAAPTAGHVRRDGAGFRFDAECWLSGIRTIRPSSASVTLIWQDRREFSSTFSAKSSIDSSMADFSPVFERQAASTYTWQVAQAHAPPQSASMPGMLFFTAPSMTLSPGFTSTTCSVPLCSM